MSRLDRLADHALNAAITSHLGELIRYTPAGGDTIEITAVVMRDPISPQGERLEHDIELYIPMSSVATINEQGDRAQLRRRVTDDDFTTFTVSRIIDQDGANWHVALN